MNPKSWFGSANRWLVAVLTVLMLTANASAAWTEKVLYSFQGGSDGLTPEGGVVFDSAGNLYGATYEGGSTCPSPGCGIIFQLSPSGGTWTETVLYGFNGTNGSYPVGSVIVDTSGNLYGTTSIGGSGTCYLLGFNVGCGVVYELSPPAQQSGAWTYTTLYNFQGGNDGLFPLGSLVFDKKGNLYGATQFGGGKGTTCNTYYGGNCGTVFELRPPKQKGGAWTEKVLYSFAGGTKGKRFGDGANPQGNLVFDSQGAIYGTTFYGGDEAGTCDGGSGGTGCGTVFKLIPPTKKGGAWTEEQLYLFQGGSDSTHPAAGVVLRGKRYVCGVTVSTAFRLTPPSKKSSQWKETTIYTFSGNGVDPDSPVVFDSKGNLYGTTLNSGGTYSGTVYRLKPPRRKGEAWTYSLLYGFAGPPDGAQPPSGPIFDKSGNLYGTTKLGGAGTACRFGCGTVFEVSPQK
jgi:uncharacterized repeat protein (TIGR03803 family)